MRAALSPTLLCLLICLLLAARLRAHADEPSLNEPDAREDLDQPHDSDTIGYFAAEPGWLWARRHEALIVTIGGQVGLLSSNPLSSARKVVGGVEGQLLYAPHRSPVLFGLGAGSLYLERNRRVIRGPWEWTRSENIFWFDDWTYSRETTTTNRSLQLRHVELLLRLQPYWGAVRPYVEGALGVGILWDGLKIDGELKRATRSAAALYGLKLGVDLQLLPHSGRNGHLLIVSLGVGRLWTGELSRTAYTASDTRGSTPVRVRSGLALWTPTVALGFAF